MREAVTADEQAGAGRVAEGRAGAGPRGQGSGSAMNSRNSFSRLTWWVSPEFTWWLSLGLTWWLSPGLWTLSKLPVLTPHASVSLRFRKQRKAVVSSNDKKMPNGILEEQGRGLGRAGPGGGRASLTP